jgi:hypothetical protein
MVGFMVYAPDWTHGAFTLQYRAPLALIPGPLREYFPTLIGIADIGDD